MAPLGPLPESMGLLLANYTPEQIRDFCDAMMEMHAAAAHAPHAVVAGASLRRKKRTKKATTAGVSKMSSAPGAPGPPGPPGNGGQLNKPTRPLNSWMAFRSYYAPLFKTFQQKDISGLLNPLWKADPFQAKWSILAKAYSIIREHKSKAAAPLDVFLALTCPYIGIINRSEYLTVMGWEVVDDGGVRLERRFVPDIASFPDTILTTNSSAVDVVAFCYHSKYVTDDGTIAAGRNDAASLTMAAQPNPGVITPTISPDAAMDLHAAASPDFSPAASHQTQDEVDEADDVYDALIAALPTPRPPQGPASVPRRQYVANAGDEALAAALNKALSEDNEIFAGNTINMMNAVHELSHSGFEFPYDEEFAPQNASPLSFQPSNMDRGNAVSACNMGTYLAPSSNENIDDFDINAFLSNDIFDLSK